MALNFIPQIWTARLLVALEKALVYAQAGVINRDYEGEIQAFGDSQFVRKRKIDAFTLRAIAQRGVVDFNLWSHVGLIYSGRV